MNSRRLMGPSPRPRETIYHIVDRVRRLCCVTANWGGECPLWVVVSSGRRNTLSQTQEMEWMGDGSKICFEVSMRWPRRSCGTAGGTHSQFNRVARQLNERSRETLGFETRAERVLMLVLHRPIEPTVISGHWRIHVRFTAESGHDREQGPCLRVAKRTPFAEVSRSQREAGATLWVFPLDTGANIGAGCVFDRLQWSTGHACSD